MKLTIEIPDAHTGAVLEYVAGLLAKSLPVEANPDPAPGHPELFAADPLKVAMDDPVDDNRPALIPVPGKRYRTRDGDEMHAVKIVQPHDRILTFVRGEPDYPFYYEDDGLPCGGGMHQWDCVEEISEPTTNP